MDKKTNVDNSKNEKPSIEDLKSFVKENEAHIDNVYFEYLHPNKNNIDNIRFYQLSLKKEASEELLNIIITSLNKLIEKIEKGESDLENFDVLNNKKTTTYFFKKGTLSKPFDLVEKISSNSDTGDMGKSKKSKKNTRNARGLLVEISNSNNSKSIYVFIDVNTFRAFRKGMFFNVSNDGKTLNSLGKNNFIGIKDEIACVFLDDYCIVLSTSQVEKLLCLNNIYEEKAKEIVSKIQESSTCKSVIENIEEIKNSTEGKGSAIFNKMLVKLDIEKIENNFNEKNKKSTFEKINKIVKDEKFKEKFEGVDIDYEKMKISYSEENRFNVISLLLDRASQTMLFGDKFFN